MKVSADILNTLQTFKTATDEDVKQLKKTIVDIILDSDPSDLKISSDFIYVKVKHEDNSHHLEIMDKKKIPMYEIHVAFDGSVSFVYKHKNRLDKIEDRLDKLELLVGESKHVQNKIVYVHR